MDFQDSHTTTTQWLVLYNAIFSYEWRVIGVSHFKLRSVQFRASLQLLNPSFFRNYPQWVVHALLRLGSEGNLLEEVPVLDEIRPNCAILCGLDKKNLIMLRNGRPSEELKEWRHEFTVTNEVDLILHGVTGVQVRLVVAEYVLVPGDSHEQHRHVAHLSMALRSALALWELHCVNAPVIGLLFERNIVTTMLTWIDVQTGDCIIQEA
ncbi:hypothetical protein BDZ89DRAFT_1133736 [Hymenopellis radicata]|nr:hypothetical protein BDZ89DRAFT_1133736 [Hymenopellis radicata]